VYCFVGTTRNARRQAEPQNTGAEKLPEHMQVMDLADGGPAWLVDIDAASFVRLRPSATHYSLPYLLHDEGAAWQQALGVAGDMLSDMEHPIRNDVALAERHLDLRQTTDSLHGGDPAGLQKVTPMARGVFQSPT
jgi:hypothetical protein